MHPSKGLHIKTFQLKNKFDKVKVQIKGKKSPQVYGMAFDGLQGVAVDNIGFRGSSGSEFIRMDMNLLAQQIKAMNVKLLVLQFGVNVAAGKQLNSYDFYERIFDKQLKALRKMAPNISILIVGLSDMAYIKEGKRVTRPSIEKVRDVQKKVAFANGCAFWDLYQAMGGKNSMVSWVESKPSLAKPDYTHFNSRGAGLVGEMLYNALLLAYAKHNKLIK
jgi:lysophospholipase L1-like esterase